MQGGERLIWWLVEQNAQPANALKADGLASATELWQQHLLGLKWSFRALRRTGRSANMPCTIVPPNAVIWAILTNSAKLIFGKWIFIKRCAFAYCGVMTMRSTSSKCYWTVSAFILTAISQIACMQYSYRRMPRKYWLSFGTHTCPYTRLHQESLSDQIPSCRNISPPNSLTSIRQWRV